MTPSLLFADLRLISGLIYLGLIIFLLARKGWQQPLTRVLLAYLLFSAMWEGAQVAVNLGWVALPIQHPIQRLIFYGIILLLGIFIYLTREFLRQPGRNAAWGGLAALWVTIALLLDFNVFWFRDPLLSGHGWAVSREAFGFFFLLLGWSVLLIGALWQTHQAARQVNQPLHLNRLLYWTMVLGLGAIGDGQRFAGVASMGSLVRLAATFIALYACLTHQLLDVRQIFRRSLGILLASLITMSLFYGAFFGLALYYTNLPDTLLWLIGSGVALALALLFNPLIKLLDYLLMRLFSGRAYDPSHLLREYSLTISQTLELERFGTVSVGVLREEMGAKDGILFVVDAPRGTSRLAYALRDVSVPPQPIEDENPVPFLEPDPGLMAALSDVPEAAEAFAQAKHTPPAPPPAPSRSGLLSAASPVVTFFKHDKRPLTQYDIDLLPRFRDVQLEERAWLSRLSMDVYVPIYAKDEWIGLIALGPKTSRERYFDDDLVWLSTMADQTAVALQNARLVDDIVHVNAALKKAYNDLETANRELQELDRLKSNFIGMITHELRTPFAKIAFSLQLLQRYGTDHWAPEQQEQLQQLNSNLQEARVMVDNLINFSAFLSKQGKLNLAEVNFATVIQEAARVVRPMADRRNLELLLKVPDQLPVIYGDRDRLVEAAQHLIHNAVKFTDKGKITVSCWATEKNITLEVKDTGVGIPKDKLASIWKGFSQMADAVKRGVEGLGLGLALVKYVVSAHGGEVWVHSMEKYGSTFGFYIPVMPKTDDFLRPH